MKFKQWLEQTNDLNQIVLDYITRHGEICTISGAITSAVTIHDMRNELGYKQFDGQNPLANPVHRAVVDLIKSGYLKAEEVGRTTVITPTGKLLEAFQHPSDIPADFAMSVYKILHNQASYPEWETLDKFSAQHAPVYDWIDRVLKANGMTNTEEEIAWFKKQLAKGMN